MKEQLYKDKITELDSEYLVLKSAMSKNRIDRGVWQKMLDNIKSSENKFPLNAKRDIKIVHILSKIFERAVTISDLESKYLELNGKHEKLNNVMRRMKSQGVLVSIRYNKQNTMTFWGLKKWLVEDDFKECYKPLKSELPLKIIKIERL